MDDLVIKSRCEDYIADDIQETFKNLMATNMKLNSTKCLFGFEEGKFLGFIVDKHGVKANPSQVRAILDLRSRRTKIDVQSLIGKIATLKRYLPILAKKIFTIL